MDVIMVKGPGGTLRPACPDDEEKLRGIKLGTLVGVTIARKRNPKFHRKIMALYQIAFEFFGERVRTGVVYRDEAVQPSFQRFRKELTILAGHYEPVYNIRGEVKLEAKSIAFSKCSEEEAVQIFSDLINAALKNVFKGATSEEELRERVQRVLDFDGG